MMIENYRTEFIWRLTRNCSDFFAGLRANGTTLSQFDATACSFSEFVPQGSSRHVAAHEVSAFPR